MEVERPSWYWIVWMSKWHTITLPNVFTDYNDIFDHMDDVMRALAKNKTQWKEDLFVSVIFVWLKLFQYHTEVTPTTGLVLISVDIIYLFRKLRWFRKQDKEMDINCEDETFDNTQYQEGFLKYLENKYCAKHRHLPVIDPESIPNHNLFSFAMASGSGQSFYQPYDLASNDAEYLMLNNVAGITPGWSDHAARVLNAARSYLNSPPTLSPYWGHVDPNLNDYQFDTKEARSTS